MAEARPSFQELQYRFALHLRDPERTPAPDIEGRRLKIYRELFYNNVEGFLANAFPVLRKISADAIWHARVRDFYSRHRCRSPQFYRLAEEFLEFLESERGAHPDDPPFLAELAHYEWVELALSISDAEPDMAQADAAGDLMNAPPVISPLAWTLSYRYPVHRIGPDYQPAEPPAQPTCLIVYRDAEDRVRFMDVNPVTARLLQRIEEQPDVAGREHLRAIATELGQAQPDQVLASGAAMMEGLRARGVLLGTRRAPPEL